MTPHVRPSVEADCVYLAAHLRDADRRECELWGHDPLPSLRTGLSYSLQPLTVVGPSGKPAAMFGLTGGTGEDATVWLLGTPEITSFPMTFLRQSRLWMDHLCRPIRGIDRVKGVGNWVDLRNTKHVDWLRWMGFTKTSSRDQSGIEIGYFRKAL